MSYRYWQELKDYFRFFYYPQRSSDGKFHACKVNLHTGRIKDVAFGKRKTAKARAYKWYCKRREALDKRKNRVEEAKRKGQIQLTVIQKKEKELRKKIDIAHKHMRELAKIIRQSQTRIKRATTLLAKWETREKRYTKALKELRKNEVDPRIKGLIDALE